MSQSALHIALSIILAVGTLLCLIPSADAATVYVDDDNPGGVAGTLADPVATIAEGIDLARANDTVRVFAGEYNETVTVDDQTFRGARIRIIGNGSGDTVVGPDNGVGFDFEYVNFMLEGFEVAWTSTALRCRGASGNVSDLKVRLGGRAIDLEDCRNVTISAIDVHGTDQFAQIRDCRRGRLTNSTFLFDDVDGLHEGIALVDSWGFTLSDLTVESFRAPGLSVIGDFDHRIETSVAVNNETIHYFNDIHGTSTTPIDIAGLYLPIDHLSSIGKITLVNSSHVRIFGNDLANPPFGSCILLVNCDDVDVGNNTINRGLSETEGDSAVKMVDCTDVLVHDITLRRSYNGIKMVGTTDSELSNVSALKCVRGLHIEEGGDNLIDASSFSDNAMAGISLVDTAGNSIEGTFMNANARYGFYIEGDYDNDIAQDCTVDTETVYYFNGLDGWKVGQTISGLVLNKHYVSNVGKVSIVNSNNLTLEDCILRNNDLGSGIFLYGSHHITLRRNTMTGNGMGIVLIGVNSSTLRDNDMDSLEHGLHIESRYDNWIFDSNAANGESIRYFYGNETVSISGLELPRKRVSNVGKITLVDVGNATVEGCRLENGTAGVMLIGGHVEVSSSLLKHNEAGTAVLSGSIRVEDCDVVANREGITSDGTMVALDNRIAHNGVGIRASNRSRILGNAINGSGMGVVIEGDLVRVESNVVLGSNLSGIDVAGRDVIVRSNTCGANRYGIFVRGGEDLKVVANTASRNDHYGIRIKGEPRNLTVSDNVVFGNGFRNPGMSGSGILLVDASNLTVEGNDVWWNQYADVAIEHCSNITVADCTLNGTPKGVWSYYSQSFTVRDCEIDAADFGIDTYETSDVAFSGNTLSAIAEYGIFLRYSSGAVVEDNEVEALHNGVFLMGTVGASVGNNTLDARHGINLSVASGNSIWDNDIVGGVGVIVRGGSEDNLLAGMDLTGLPRAVVLDGANGTTIRGCTFDSNVDALVMDGAWKGLVSRCSFSDTDDAIEMVGTDRFSIEGCDFSHIDVAVHIRQSDRNDVHNATAASVDAFLRSYEGFMNGVHDTDLSGTDTAARLSGGSEALFINVTYDDGQLDLHDSSALFVMNYLKVRVLYLDHHPLEGAGVRVTEKDTVRYRSITYMGYDADTNEKGEIPWIRVAYATYRVGSKRYPRVFANATMLSWEENREVDMSTSHVEVFVSNITAPYLEWTGEPGYQDAGVSPLVGNSSAVFGYRVFYSDGSGDPPLASSPWVWIDVNGDGAYNMTFPTVNGTFAEGKYVMTKVGSSTDYVEGVVYRFRTALPVSGSLTYTFGARDSNGLLAIEGEPLATHHGPTVMDGDLDIAGVVVDGPDVRLHARLRLNDGTYPVPESEDDVRVVEGVVQSATVSVPSSRAISLLMDWSSSVPADARSSVMEWMAPFLDGLTAADIVEVAKYESQVHWVSSPGNDVNATAEAVNASVASGSEAHLYDAIAGILGSGSRCHVVVVTFGPDFALHPSEHVGYGDLLLLLDEWTSVHVVAVDVADDDEMADLASLTGGTFANVGMKRLPGAVLDALRAVQGEFIVEYSPDMTFNGETRWGNLSVSLTPIEEVEGFSYSAPRTPAPIINLTYPGGWWPEGALPVSIDVQGEHYTLVVEFRRAPLADGQIGLWSGWMEANVTAGELDIALTPGAYQIRAIGTSISGDTHGWVNESNGNVTLFDPTPLEFEGAVADAVTGDDTQLRFQLGTASDPEAGIRWLVAIVSRAREMYN
ncbi:MAG: right-handed parallel beta-helix repeat-containing protein, partial [Thermoplasmata archaeon]|nr:right-handed parallel beta-helix repeat-containing protein [Thermoplasmata archaeon]